MTSDRTRFWIFLSAGVCAAVGVVGFVFFVRMAMRQVTNPQPATSAERRLVVTAQALVPFGLEGPIDEKRENMRVMRQFDGSRNVMYSYVGRSGLWIMSRAQVLPQSLTAMQIFKMEQLTSRATTSLANSDNVKLVPRPDLVTIGDQNYAGVYERDGKPIGNLFILRQSRVVHTLTVQGFVLEKRADVEKLFEPIFAETKRQFL